MIITLGESKYNWRHRHIAYMCYISKSLSYFAAEISWLLFLPVRWEGGPREHRDSAVSLQTADVSPSRRKSAEQPCSAAETLGSTLKAALHCKPKDRSKVSDFIGCDKLMRSRDFSSELGIDWIKNYLNNGSIQIYFDFRSLDGRSEIFI